MYNGLHDLYISIQSTKLHKQKWQALLADYIIQENKFLEIQNRHAYCRLRARDRKAKTSLYSSI